MLSSSRGVGTLVSVSANRLPLAARAGELLVSPSALGRWAAVAAVAVAYFVTASLALKLAIPPGYASAFWPPAGIALAAWLLLGPRVWPGIWLGATLANYGVLGTPVLSAMAIGAGNTAEAAVAGLLIGRFVGTPLRFEHPDEPWRFAAVACAACLLAATGGVLTLALSGRVPWGELGTHWFIWWLGDATSIFILAPLLLAWLRPAAAAARPRRAEGAVFLAILVLCGALAQIEERTLRDAMHVLAYLMIPLITWAATRLDLRAVTAASFATGVVAVVDLVDGRAALFGPLALAGALLLMQVVISLMALLGLTLSAMAAELAHAREALARRAAPADADAADLLSKREMDVLRLIVEGKTSAEAALILHLSPRSVETYRGRVMHKLDIHNLPALVKYAIRRGITTLDYPPSRGEIVEIRLPKS
jgi:integral membrane sensor domain MASE1/DNA-binding CsgD family transcriptional regulator